MILQLGWKYLYFVVLARVFWFCSLWGWNYQENRNTMPISRLLGTHAFRKTGIQHQYQRFQEHRLPGTQASRNTGLQENRKTPPISRPPGTLQGQIRGQVSVCRSCSREPSATEVEEKLCFEHVARGHSTTQDPSPTPAVTGNSGAVLVWKEVLIAIVKHHRYICK